MYFYCSFLKLKNKIRHPVWKLRGIRKGVDSTEDKLSGHKFLNRPYLGLRNLHTGFIPCHPPPLSPRAKPPLSSA